ncbi:hypothetical protein Tco_1361595 [Tanacetum coccineum]
MGITMETIMETGMGITMETIMETVNGNGNGLVTGNGQTWSVTTVSGNENHNVNGRGDRLVARECTYQDFMKCQPTSFKGTKGVCTNLSGTSQENHRKLMPPYALSMERVMKLMTSVYSTHDAHQNGSRGGRLGGEIHWGGTNEKIGQQTMETTVGNNTTKRHNNGGRIVARAYVGLGVRIKSFSALLEFKPYAFDIVTANELANGKEGFMKPTCAYGLYIRIVRNPFIIDLMPIELLWVSFGCLSRHGLETKGAKEKKSKLSIISCEKAQKYIEKGCQLFLAQVTVKENKDKSEEKRLEDVPTLEPSIGYAPSGDGRSCLLKLQELTDKDFKAKFLPGELIRRFERVLMQKRKVIALCFSPAKKAEEEHTRQNDLDLGACGKANVVADALSRKNRPKLLRVRALIMTIGLNLPSRILNARVKARKEENYGTEDLHGMIKNLEPRADGTLCLKTHA